MQFRLSGEHTRLDVDHLNEQLKAAGAQRIRQTMRPDEAYGLIFQFEHVISNTRALQQAAWQRVAAANDLHYPSIERPQMYNMRPERTAMHVLQWTQDMNEARSLAWDVAAAYSELLLEMQEPRPGVQVRPLLLSVLFLNHAPNSLVLCVVVSFKLSMTSDAALVPSSHPSPPSLVCMCA